MSDRKFQIIQIAQDRIQAGGYNSFSFRDIAAEIGIKSASVHYHFPTKEDLACAVIDQYSEHFFRFLDEQTEGQTTPESLLGAYCRTFTEAYKNTGKSCLCGILSSEAHTLPDSVRSKLNDFLQANMDWLENAYSSVPSVNSTLKARLFYTGLEGAISASALTGDSKWVESVASELLSSVF